MIIEYIKALFDEVKLDDFDIPAINWKIRDVRFHSVESNVEDLDVWIEGDLLKVRIRNAGGSFSGSALSPKMWPRKGFFNNHFNFNCDKGGFKSIAIDFGITKEFVMGRTLPMLNVRYSKFEMDGRNFRIDVQSDDWAIKTGSFIVNTFKDAYIFTMQPILNVAFPSIANIAMKMIQNGDRGDVNSDIIQTIVDELPNNNILIPGSIFMNYEEADDNRARIENGRIIGYFKGEVIGMPDDQKITEEKYMQDGDLGLTSDEPFEYQISTRVINLIFEVILGNN